MSNDDNVIPFGSIPGGKEDEEEFPSYPYIVIDVDDNEYDYEGYLIFTSHHVCIMEDGGSRGPVAGLMLPLNRVKVVVMAEDEVVGTEH